MRRRTNLFCRGNTRCGEVWHISLPPGLLGTCPGATDLCDGLSYDRQGRSRFACYAKRGHNSGRAAREYREYVYRCSLTAAFVPMAITELAYATGKAVRVHPAGDFYSDAYVRKWVRIAIACPKVHFWAYTRSWRLPTILTALKKLAQVKNFSLFWSTDIETHKVNGSPPLIPHVRVAYMKMATHETVPDYVDLVWKDKRGVAYPQSGLKACPQGVLRPTVEHHSEIPITCAECRWCIVARRSKRERVTT